MRNEYAKPWPAAVHLDLPFPPSVNSYWRHPSRGPLAGRHLISREGRRYRERVAAEVLAQCGQRPSLDGRLSVSIVVFPPDRRRRDLDNLLKSLLDAMQHAGVYVDDSLIDQLRVERGESLPGGSVSVDIGILPVKDTNEAAPEGPGSTIPPQPATLG